MFKTIVRYLRRKSIEKNTAKKRRHHAVLNLSQPLTIGVLIEDGAPHIDDIRKEICRLFNTMHCLFFIFDAKSDKTGGMDKVGCFVGRHDLNVFGLLNEAGRNNIGSVPVDMLIDVAKEQPDGLLLKDYLVSQIKSAWKVSFASKYNELFDIVIAPKEKSDIAEKIGDLHRYLSMLYGNR